jgi:acetyl-CoA carboxylase biotin carboxyl carrier protein
MKGTRNKKRSSSTEFSMPGVDVEQLELLLEFMAVHGLEEFEYEHSGLHIRLRKAAAQAASHPQGSLALVPAVMAPPPVSPGLNSQPAASAGSTESAAPPEPVEELHTIKSPIVGTFYSAPSPEAPPFVHGGDPVRVGQVVCIIEAMKLMNEIEADVSGEVVRALVENGQPVEYGQGLFTIRPSGKK